MKGRFKRKGDTMFLYGIYDKKADAYVDFMFSRHAAEIVRMCGMLVNRDGSIQHAYADDFDVRKLAEIDEKSGEVIPGIEHIAYFGALLSDDED